MGTAIDESGRNVTDSTQAQLQLSFASAENLAQHNPAYASQITAAAQSSFLDGDNWAYAAAIVAVLIGMALVFRFFREGRGERAARGLPRRRRIEECWPDQEERAGTSAGLVTWAGRFAPASTSAGACG